MKTEAENGVCIYKPRNAKDCQQPLKAEREAWNRYFPRASEGAQPYWHFDFRLKSVDLWENKFLFYSVTQFTVLRSALGTWYSIFSCINWPIVYLLCEANVQIFGHVKVRFFIFLLLCVHIHTRTHSGYQSLIWYTLHAYFLSFSGFSFSSVSFERKNL